MPALTVVMAAKGYPGDYAKGTRIEGLDDAAKIEGVEIFHAGTVAKDGAILANGGRVLNVCASGKTVGGSAATAPTQAVDRIKWPDGFCRRDIAWQAVEQERANGWSNVQARRHPRRAMRVAQEPRASLQTASRLTPAVKACCRRPSSSRLQRRPAAISVRTLPSAAEAQRERHEG